MASLQPSAPLSRPHLASLLQVKSIHIRPHLNFHILDHPADITNVSLIPFGLGGVKGGLAGHGTREVRGPEGGTIGVHCYHYCRGQLVGGGGT